MLPSNPFQGLTDFLRKFFSEFDQNSFVGKKSGTDFSLERDMENNLWIYHSLCDTQLRAKSSLLTCL